ncbi:MAG: peptidase, partial [Betaproteobacteria bacterium]
MKKVALAAALAAAFAGGVALTEWREDARIARPVNAAAQAPAAAAPAAAADTAPVAGLPDFSALVERVGPAVVNIAVAGKAAPPVQGPPGGLPQDPCECFRRCTPQPGPGPGDEAPQRP